MITVVSGLPRSGTSLVMQMLAASGHPILADDERSADEDNPRGYFEFAPVKSLERDASWLHEAEGRAVKIVSFLLTSLPADLEYRVIFLRRDLDEVLRSQERMLCRREQPSGPDADMMKAHFTRHLQRVDHWLLQQPHIQVLNVSHAALIHEARTTSRTILEFLGCELKIDQMAQAVDPGLYRQRQ